MSFLISMKRRVDCHNFFFNINHCFHEATKAFYSHFLHVFFRNGLLNEFHFSYYTTRNAYVGSEFENVHRVPYNTRLRRLSVYDPEVSSPACAPSAKAFGGVRPKCTLVDMQLHL